MKNKKNLYTLLILFSFPLTLLIVTILRIFTKGNVVFDNTAITLMVISIIVYSVIKYKSE